jgi:hypothetical protein
MSGIKPIKHAPEMGLVKPTSPRTQCGSHFPFVKEDKDKDEKPKATGIIEFLLKQRAASHATARSKVLD